VIGSSPSGDPNCVEKVETNIPVITCPADTPFGENSFQMVAWAN